MALPSQASGRSTQRARTRTAIIGAARRLREPTVEQAADAAGVSRATAYRYFPTQEALRVELETADYWREAEAVVASLRSPSPERRLDRIIDAIVETVTADERSVRTALRVYHDTWLRDPSAPIRRGRRMEWIDRALEPLSPELRDRLRVPLALVVGPDQVTMLKDVAGLGPTEIKRVLKHAARALVRAALTEPAA